jgi:hypothetical protein
VRVRWLHEQTVSLRREPDGWIALSPPLVGRVVVIVTIFALLAFAVTGCNRVGSGSEASRECRGLAHLAEAAQKFSAFLTESNPDPKKFIEEFHDFAAFRFLDLVSRVPIEIRADVRVLDNAFLKYVDVISNLEVPEGNLDRKTLEKFQHPSIDIDVHKIRQASQNISAWVQRMQKNCT